MRKYLLSASVARSLYWSRAMGDTACLTEKENIVECIIIMMYSIEYRKNALELYDYLGLK